MSSWGERSWANSLTVTDGLKCSPYNVIVLQIDFSWWKTWPSWNLPHFAEVVEGRGCYITQKLKILSSLRFFGGDNIYRSSWNLAWKISRHTVAFTYQIQPCLLERRGRYGSPRIQKLFKCSFSGRLSPLERQYVSIKQKFVIVEQTTISLLRCKFGPDRRKVLCIRTPKKKFSQMCGFLAFFCTFCSYGWQYIPIIKWN